MQTRDNLKEFLHDIGKQKKEISDLMRRKMPVHAGRIAKDHFQENFRKGGFVDNGLHKWKKSNRELHGGKSAASNYGTLLSGRNHLYSSIRYVPGDARVTISNDVPYAGIHNWGGTATPKVTPKMRKFAWAKYYASGGGKKTENGALNPDAQFWRNLALTKKSQLNIKMPQRQFLGESKELTDKINEKLESELEKILFK